MAKKEALDPPHDFKQLLEYASFKGIEDLLVSMRQKWGYDIISRAELFKIRNGQNRNLQRRTLKNLSKALSLKGKDIGVREIEKRLNIDIDDEPLLLSNYLQSLVDHLKNRLVNIRYKDRTLTPTQPSIFTVGEPKSSRGTIWTPENLLENAKHAIITAEPGMGKSTLLDKLALIGAENGKVPVYVDLKAASSVTFEDFKTEVWADAISYNRHPDLKISSDGLSAQDFVFLFDNLDMAVPQGTAEVPYEVGHLNTFTAERSESNDSFFVCCRTNFDSYFCRLNDRFMQFSLLELDVGTDVKRLLREYGIERLHPDGEKNRRLLDFSRSPYHLELLVKIFAARKKEGKELELEREVEIYEQFIDLHLDEEQPKWKSKGSPDVKKTALAWLAYEVLASDNPNARKFSRSWASDRLRRTIIPKVGGDISQEHVQIVIKEILAEGLIVLSPDGKRYAFSHPILGDFFCAWHLARNLSPKAPEQILLQYMGQSDKMPNPIWDRVTIFCAGLAEDATWLIEMLIDKTKIKEDIFHTNLRLAGRCLPEARKDIGEKLEDRIVGELLDVYWNTTNESFGRIVLGILQKINSETKDIQIVSRFSSEVGGSVERAKSALRQVSSRVVFESLVKVMNNTDSDLLECVLSALVSIDSRKALEILVGKLNAADHNLKLHIVSLLEEVCIEEAIEPLIVTLNDQETSIRVASVLALEKVAQSGIGCARVVEALVARLGDNDDHVRVQTAISLGTLKSEEAVDAIILKLDDANSEVITESAHALKMINSERVVAKLIVRLRDGNSEVRYNTAYALGVLRPNGAVEALIERLENDTDADVRSEVAWALGETGSRDAIESLTERLKDESSSVRLSALEALARIDPEKHFDCFVKMLHDPEGAVVLASIEILGKMKREEAVEPLLGAFEEFWNKEVVIAALERIASSDSEKAVDALINLLNSDDENIRNASFRALEPGFSSKAIDAIVDRSEDSSPNTRCMAIHTLKSIGRRTKFMPLVAQHLIRTLDDESEEVKLEAIHALERIGTREVTEHMIRMLGSPNAGIRCAAAVNLGKIHQTSAVGPLIGMLSDKSDRVREMIAYALGTIGDARAVEQLTKMFNDGADEVRKQVFLALGNIGSENAVKPLLEIVRDESSPWRMDAVDALGTIGSKDAIGDLCRLLKQGFREDEIYGALLRISQKTGVRITQSMVDSS